MFTSDTKQHKRHVKRTAFTYLGISAFCALFGLIYEYFSFGVYSPFMVWAFLFPLLGGSLPLLVMLLCRWRPLPGRLVLQLYHSAIAAFTVGSLMQGVLDIYGTTNSLIGIYWWCGAGLMVLSLILYGTGLLQLRSRAQLQKGA